MSPGVDAKTVELANEMVVRFGDAAADLATEMAAAAAYRGDTGMADRLAAVATILRSRTEAQAMPNPIPH